MLMRQAGDRAIGTHTCVLISFIYNLGLTIIGTIQAVSIAESDLDTHRPVERRSSGYATRSELFAARKAKDVALARYAVMPSPNSPKSPH